MPKRKTRSKQRTRRAAPSKPMPGWIWGLFGLTVGLSIAAAIYVKDREMQPPRATSSNPGPFTVEPVTRPAADIAEKPEPRFKFYDMLPNFEVIIPEQDTVVYNDSQLAPLNIPGIYVLQAGSFSSYADADRMKARLAVLGISSRIQNVSIDAREYHRVRIGPVDSLDQLNNLRDQLRNAAIDIMVIRVGG